MVFVAPRGAWNINAIKYKFVIDIIHFQSSCPKYGEACDRKKLNYIVRMYISHPEILG